MLTIVPSRNGEGSRRPYCPCRKREGRRLSSPAKNGSGGGTPFLQALVVPEHTVWGSLVGSTRKAHGSRASGDGQGTSSARWWGRALAGGWLGGILILAPLRHRIERCPQVRGRSPAGSTPALSTAALSPAHPYLSPPENERGVDVPTAPAENGRGAGVSPPLPSLCTRVLRGRGLRHQTAQGSRPPLRLTLDESKCRRFPLPSLSGRAGRDGALDPLSPASVPQGGVPLWGGTESGDESQGTAVKGERTALPATIPLLRPGRRSLEYHSSALTTKL